MITVSTPAWPAAMRASRLPNSSKIWLICSVVSRTAVDSRPEGIVLFVGHFRIDQRAGLDALACRDANVALGGGQAGTCGERALERGPEREGLRTRPARQPRADQQRGRTRDTRGRFGEHKAT